MEPRISLITLGVADVARSRAFYEALGWRASSASTEEVVFFQGNGLGLALWGRAALAADAGLDDCPSGFSGVSIAHNLRSEAEVDDAYAAALAAGAEGVKRLHRTFWGGYVGYFADPDGHLWELAHDPHSTSTAKATSTCRSDLHARLHIDATRLPSLQGEAEK